MHENFREALNDAVGQSDYVIVVILDIRGFSEFSTRRESPDVAMYIKRVYMKLIDEYFPSAKFYKPTGDGMLIVFPCDEKTLPDKSREIIQSCLRCHREFADICRGDSIINFDVPRSIGIGIARGTTCCLKSGDTILDYSGHLLNLTARLMGIARPSGIVIDGAFGIDLLSKDNRDLFVKAQAYLRSIAEDTPVDIYVLKDVVNIPPENVQPLAEERWEKMEIQSTVKEFLAITSAGYRVHLNAPLKKPDAFEVDCVHKSLREGRESGQLETIHRLYEPEYKLIAGEPIIRVIVSEVKEYLKGKRAPPDMKIKINVAYLPRIRKP